MPSLATSPVDEARKKRRGKDPGRWVVRRWLCPASLEELAEQSTSKLGEIGRASFEEVIDHGLIVLRKFFLHEVRDGLEGGIDLLRAESESGKALFEFFHG